MRTVWRMVLLVLVVALFGFLTGVVVMAQREAQRRVRIPERVDARSFRLLDAEGRVRAELSMPFGEPALFLYDQEGKPRAWLLLDQEGNPKAMFVDKQQVPLWQAPPEKASDGARRGD